MPTVAMILPTLAINFCLVFVSQGLFPDSRIWLAEIDIKSSLDFPI